MKKIIIILISVLFGVTFATLGCIILIDGFVYHWSLNLSDWLSAICAILSLIGTVSLAVVAVLQTDKANRQNEALAKQNEELQKINDRQFKIANQRFYPLLEVEKVELKSYYVTEEINLENWQNGCSNYIDSENHGSSFEVDARFDKTKKPELKSTVTFNIRNISDAIIKSIDIYKITICSPFNNIVDTAWFLFVFTFSKNKSHFIKISFYHNNSIFISRNDAAIFSLFLKLTTVSDVVFYEKIDLFAPPWDGYGEIKQISEEEIIN